MSGKNKLINHIVTEKGQFLFIPVHKDAYRPTLIKNPELTGRYGHFEWTERTNGLEHYKDIPAIEHWEIYADTNMLTEDLWKGIVDNNPKRSAYKFKVYTTGWKSADVKGNYARKAATAGFSLLQSRRMDNRRWIILKMRTDKIDLSMY